MYRRVGIWRKKIEDTRHCLELQRGQVKKGKNENNNIHNRNREGL